MDPRLADRRRRVAEDRARSNMARLIRFLLFVTAVAGLVWFAQSPFLSVSEIVVTGASRVDVRQVLHDHGVSEGRAMVALDLDEPERLLSVNPWVEQVSVARKWPTTVIVEVVERTPAVNVRFANGWSLVAADGTVLERIDVAAPDLPQAEFDTVPSRDGGEDLQVVGAVEYLAGLPDQYRLGAVVRPATEGLEAVVDGFTVRLGGPFEMASKAAVTGALLDTGLEEGAILTVVAPASRAVLPPGALEAPSETDGSDGTDTTEADG